jgi:hypothetical protein
MKQCPKCGRKWPDTGKFCPFDGSALEEQQKPKAAEPAIRTSATVVMEAPKDIEALKAKIDGPQPAGKKQSFSETQWFMKGITPEDLEELDVDSDLEAAGEKYKKDENLETGVREKFSLAEDFVQHEKKEKGGWRSIGDAFLGLARRRKKK